jgi:hypothetical protein
MRISHGVSPFYHKSGCVSHSVSHHKSGHVSFYHESRCISHSVYRETSVKMTRFCFVCPLKSMLPARAEQWRHSILHCSFPILTISFSFLGAISKNLVVTKHNSCKGQSSPPSTPVVFAHYTTLQ